MGIFNVAMVDADQDKKDEGKKEVSPQIEVENQDDHTLLKVDGEERIRVGGTLSDQLTEALKVQLAKESGLGKDVELNIVKVNISEMPLRHLKRQLCEQKMEKGRNLVVISEDEPALKRLAMEVARGCGYEPYGDDQNLLDRLGG